MKSIPGVSPEVTRHSAFVSLPVDHVILEIYKKDDEPFDKILPRDTLKEIWSTLGRDNNEVKILTFRRMQTKCLRVSYKLVKEVPISEITPSHEIRVEATVGPKIHLFAAKFPQFREIVCELGNLITVTFFNLPEDVYAEDLEKWLSIFGKTQGRFRFAPVSFSFTPPLAPRATKVSSESFTLGLFLELSESLLRALSESLLRATTESLFRAILESLIRAYPFPPLEKLELTC
jgi:hypothetical protein